MNTYDHRNHSRIASKGVKQLPTRHCCTAVILMYLTSIVYMQSNTSMYTVVMLEDHRTWGDHSPLPSIALAHLLLWAYTLDQTVELAELMLGIQSLMRYTFVVTVEEFGGL